MKHSSTRQHPLRLLVGIPLIIAVIATTACSNMDVKPSNAPKPASYISADRDGDRV